MITLTNIHKSFDQVPVLQGVSLHVARGESCVIIGGSGSGKSVLLKCILGLETPDSGAISIDGHPNMPMDRFGMLFQGAALFDSLTVWENVSFVALQNGQDRSGARKAAIATLDRVGLSEKTADLYPAALSGGMAKRAGLARAIATNPDIIFFDEPTTGLDPIRAATINTLIRDIVTEMGATTVTITHDMTTVAQVADRVAMLKDGDIHWQGTKAELDASRDIDVVQFTKGRPA